MAAFWQRHVAACLKPFQSHFHAVPEMDVKPVRQRYTCLQESPEGGLYKYEGLGTGFEANLPVDGMGLVVDYPGLCGRLWEG